jgi:hypothetical protein
MLYDLGNASLAAEHRCFINWAACVHFQPTVDAVCEAFNVKHAHHASNSNTCSIANTPVFSPYDIKHMRARKGLARPQVM